jgi:hypothetical protein
MLGTLLTLQLQRRLVALHDENWRGVVGVVGEVQTRGPGARHSA